jgi:molybdopterin molybdotransferase
VNTVPKAELLPVAEARARILADAAPLPEQVASLDDALGRVLTQDLKAQRTQPPAAVSAMDGYAVRGADVAQKQATLKVIGESGAGHPFSGSVGAGEAVRIFTGAVMPGGSDTVVIQEIASREGDSVRFAKPTATGRNVRLQGIDFAAGQTLLTKGRRLTDRDLMLAAAMNYPALPVHSRPKVAVFGTGDELAAPGSKLGRDKIVYSNGFALRAVAKCEGAAVFDFGVVPDTVEAIAGAVRRAREVKTDVLVTSGGASVGEHDLVQRALTAEGLDLAFWRLALRPGRPMMYGRLGAMQVLGLPGNPVSAYVCAFLFLAPLIRRLAGRKRTEPLREQAVLGRDLPQNDEREDYLRATLANGPAGAIAIPLPAQDSSLMVPLAKADCLLIRPPFAPPAPAGSQCVILKLAL